MKSNYDEGWKGEEKTNAALKEKFAKKSKHSKGKVR